jgi:uncharacterized protein YcfJ
MKTRRLTALSAAALLAAGSALADGPARAQYDFAQVLSADPIIRYVTVKTPVRECWQDTQVRVVERGGRRNNAGGALIGAVIGGVVGNQFGSGRGNDAATVAGSLLGAAIGSESARNRARETVRYETPVERCETVITEREEERIDGYQVVYRYNGQRYSTRMPYDPGDRLRVRVDVRPAN